MQRVALDTVHGMGEMERRFASDLVQALTGRLLVADEDYRSFGLSGEIEWSVSPGDTVTAGQEIGVVEVVKASVAIVAPVAGHIGALCVPAGTTFGRDAFLALVRTD